MEFVGLARGVRRAIEKAAEAYGARADKLLEPFQTGAGPAQPRVRKVDLVRLFHGWRKLPAFGRLGPLAIALDKDELRITETRLYPGRVARRAWDGDEVTIDIRRIRLTIGLHFCAGDVHTLASAGLHATGRRLQRGTTSGLAPILDDLEALGNSYQTVLDEGVNDFSVAAPSGGKWLGTILRNVDGRPSLVVRTFVRGRE
jgi:hypothetical protein